MNDIDQLKIMTNEIALTQSKNWYTEYHAFEKENESVYNSLLAGAASASTCAGVPFIKGAYPQTMMYECLVPWVWKCFVESSMPPEAAYATIAALLGQTDLVQLLTVCPSHDGQDATEKSDKLGEISQKRRKLWSNSGKKEMVDALVKQEVEAMENFYITMDGLQAGVSDVCGDVHRALMQANKFMNVLPAHEVSIDQTTPPQETGVVQPLSKERMLFSSPCTLTRDESGPLTP